MQFSGQLTLQQLIVSAKVQIQLLLYDPVLESFPPLHANFNSNCRYELNCTAATAVIGNNLYYDPMTTIKIELPVCHPRFH